MPLVLDGSRYYTTTEAAARLGVRPGSVRDAVARGALAARGLVGMRRNVIAEDELARYEAVRAAHAGWATRKAADYTPHASRSAYQREWRRRKRDQMERSGVGAGNDQHDGVRPVDIDHRG